MKDSSENTNEDIAIDAMSPYLRPYEFGPIHRIAKKIGRNDKCPYTDLKFKNCCGKENRNFCPKLIKDYIDRL